MRAPLCTMTTEPGGPDTNKDRRPDAEIIDLRAARRRETARRRALAGIVPETPEQVRRRMIQNVSAGLLVLALVGGGSWLIVRLRDSLKLEACFESGRRNCARIDTTQIPKSQ